MVEKQEDEKEFVEQKGSPVTVRDLTRPDWRERLDEYTYNTDPWEVSVTELASGFMSELDELSGRNLKISGRMVLTCAVLLKAKAEKLAGRGQEDEEEELEEGPDAGFWGYEEFESESYVPELELPLKRMSERAVTKEELSQAFSSSVEVYERREERLEMEDEETPYDWGMDLGSEDNFQVKLQRLYRKVKEKFSRGKEVLFSALLDRETKEEKFHTFMELLHLQSEGKVKCKQENPFSEIKVELTEDDAPEESVTEPAKEDE